MSEWSNPKPYDYTVFIARSQPFHKDHLRNVMKAYELADKVIFLVGRTVTGERTYKDPFTFEEVVDFIVGSVPPEVSKDLIISYITDVPGDNKKWAESVRQTVHALQITHPGAGTGGTVCLVGCRKDQTSFYLDLFPDWDFHGVEKGQIDATTIRELYFSDVHPPVWRKNPYHMVSERIWDRLNEFRHTKAWYDIHADYLYQKNEIEPKEKLLSDSIIQDDNEQSTNKEGST